MNPKPEALRLAEQLEDPVNAKMYLAPYIAAELRKLHEANQTMLDALKKAVKLNGFREFNDHIPTMKVAITKAEEK